MQALPRNDDERLQLWPFPQQVPEGVDRATFWREYRKKMIASAGVCIVLAGNKRDDTGSIVPADGVQQEVEIALSQGKIVVPVGATGHVAMKLWERCRTKQADFLGTADVTAQLNVLGDPTAGVHVLVNAIVEILKQLDR